MCNRVQKKNARLAYICLCLGQVMAFFSCSENLPSPDPEREPRRALEYIPASNTRTLPGLGAPVHIVRTEGGIPHIYGETENDVMRAQGFVLATDRYFQLDLLRRYGAGTLSNLIGDSALALDITSRSRKMHEVGARLCDQATATEAHVLDAFAAGINAYIEAVRRGELPAPSEYRVTQSILRPNTLNLADMLSPFAREDLCALAGAIAFSMGWEDEDLRLARAEEEVLANTQANELRRGAVADVLRRMDSAQEFATAPERGAEMAFNTIATPLRDRTPRDRTAHTRVTRPDTRKLARLDLVLQAFARIPQLRTHAEEMGSNMWSVRDASSTWLAGDWHLPLTVPGLVYGVGLHTRALGPENEAIEQTGFVFPGLPWAAVGANGNTAWVSTYPELDTTDWYEEELVLDADGAPSGTRFRGEVKSLRRTEERYDVADVPLLMSRGGAIAWSRYETFDGRPIVWIEGEQIASTEPSAARAVNVDGRRVVPQDVDRDGKISAVSFDFASFDASNLYGTLRNISRASSVAELQGALSGNVGYTQNLLAIDRDGHTLYSNYAKLPCRAQLRGTTGEFVRGGDPHGLIDGTQFAGFALAEDAPEGAERCGITRALYPEVVDGPSAFPARRINANNDPAGLSFDGRLDNDTVYLGGPWAPGYRARHIDETLEAAQREGALSFARIRQIQLDTCSNVALHLAPILLARLRAIETQARNHEDRAASPEMEAVLSEYRPARAHILDTVRYLENWLERGANASSGVRTFYSSSDIDASEDAVATTLWNSWLYALHHQIWDDEAFPSLFSEDPVNRMVNVMARVIVGIGPGNPEHLASYDARLGASIFFDDRNTEALESVDQVLVRALRKAFADNASAARFGSENIASWRWGYLHTTRLESILVAYAGAELPSIEPLLRAFAITPRRLPLAPDATDRDDRRDALAWFPRSGDLQNVNAASWRIDREDFSNAYGAVYRMIVKIDAQGKMIVRGVLPAGQSGLNDSQHFSDQAAQWLRGEDLPLPLSLADVLQHAQARDVLVPE